MSFSVLAWERDETADAKRKAKRAKYECRLWRRVGSHHFEFSEFADALEAFKQVRGGERSAPVLVKRGQQHGAVGLEVLFP